MSRSIHENRARKGAWHVDWDELATKRRVKKMVREERIVLKVQPRIQAQQPESVPIVMVPCADEILFSPVSARDIRGVLTCLPRDILGGVRSIRVRGWTASEACYISLSNLVLRYDCGPLRDAFADHVFVPRTSGRFMLRSGDIILHYYARATSMRPTPFERATLQSHFLHTLLHEVAHAFDRAHRVQRGRWRLDDIEKDERFASRKAAEWFDSAVRPYMNRRGLRCDPVE